MFPSRSPTAPTPDRRRQLLHDPDHRVEVLFTVETTLEAVLDAAHPGLSHNDTAHYAVQWLTLQLRDAFEGTACCPWPSVMDDDFPLCTAPAVEPTDATRTQPGARARSSWQATPPGTSTWR